MTRIRQMQKMNELRQKNLTAKKILLQARTEGKDLSAEEKQRLLKDIIKYETARYRYTADVTLSTSIHPNMWNKEYHALVEHTKKLPKEAGVFGAYSQRGTSSAPVSADNLMLGGLSPRTIPKPDVLNMLDDPKKMAQMDKAIDNLIRKEGLAEAGMGHIVNKLVINDSIRDYEYSADSLMTKIIMANPNTGRQQQEPEQPVQERKAEGPAGPVQEGQKPAQPGL